MNVFHGYDQLITIRDIAKRANVSSATVSRVLNDSSPVKEEKRAAVLEAMKALDFQPNLFARGLASGESRTIGIAVQMSGSSFYNLVSDGVSASLEELGYSPIYSNRKHRPGIGLAAITTLINRRVDGLILMGGDVSARELKEIRNTMPTIVVGRDISGRTEETVYIDNFKPAYELTKVLIEAGHRRIAHISGNQKHYDGRQRLEGYQQALKDHGIQPSEELIYEGDFSSQSGVIGVNSLLSRGINFSAVFAGNDPCAYGVRLALYQKGIRVPDDVSIVGFDDQRESAYMTPPLTTVHQPARELGEAAGKAIVALARGEPFEPPEFVAEIVHRDSVRRRV
ncbi:ribose operon repressor [Rhodopirellula sallentina SM41]|uniref:Ribose operon repressor n=1 Tax=Rhodopirellula sallentina SM41 TaxID=1263870 RepID=M5U111_9BACT|nr:ribose operon repressor [Rhodopirellula sallentina SM41]